MNCIGIFDSGVGGLGIFQEIKKLLPEENIIYLADTKNCPYGEKSIQQIEQICLDNTKFLISKGAKIVVVACNTGSTIALQYVRNKLNLIQPRRFDGKVPVVGVVPVVKTAAEMTKNKRIGILATRRTIQSKYLRNLVDEFCPPALGFRVYYQAANPLVEMVEKFQTPNSKSQINSKSQVSNPKLIKKYLNKFIKNKVDTIALGCTHFPFLSQQIEQILGSKVKVLDSNAAVARQVKRALTNNKQLAISDKPVYQFYASKDSDKFRQQIFRLISLKINKITLLT